MKIVRELMVPLASYSHISEDSTLFEAFLALEKALHKPQDSADPYRPRDRAVIVMDKNDQVLGKLSMWDAIKGLDPRYGRQIDPLAMPEDYGLWEKPLQNLIQRAKTIKAKDLLGKLSEGEYIADDTPLEQALHRLIAGQHLSLLVMQGKKAVGILRLSDAFREISALLEADQAETSAI